MNKTLLVFKRELQSFIHGGIGMFLLYGILVLVWSFSFYVNIDSVSGSAGMLWLIFFSVIVSSNFSTSTFISERVQGSLEILFTVGIKRKSILNGKILFVMVVSLILGGFCYATVLFFYFLKFHNFFSIVIILKTFLLYVVACFLNVSCGAWFSVKTMNPRLLGFINFFLLGTIIVIYMILQYFFALNSMVLGGILFSIGMLFYRLALRGYQSEKVIQHVVY